MTATIQDYAKYTRKEGDFTEAETLQINFLLPVAARILKLHTRGNWSAPVTDPHAPEDPDKDMIANVIQVQMVKRVIDNPDGITQESLDGYSYSKAAGRIYLDDDEKELLEAEGIYIPETKNPPVYSIPRSMNGGYPW